MIFSPNLKILSDWRSSLSTAFTQLRRTQFVVQDSFTFTDFDPQLDFQGMAATDLHTYRARYCKIGNMLWYSVDFSATLAVGLGFGIRVYMTLPATASETKPVSGNTEVSTGLLRNAGVYEQGSFHIIGGSNIGSIFRTALAAYTAGAWSFTINGFIETL